MLTILAPYTHTHTHMLAPLLSICACERDLFRAVTTLSTALFIMFFHSECVQVFTVRRRRKERKEKMKTNVSGLNVWTADGEEDGDRETLGEGQK